MDFLEGTEHGRGDRDMLVRFTDLSVLASRFGMRSLSTWGVRKTSRILKSLDLANYAWDENVLCKMLSCLDQERWSSELSEILLCIFAVLIRSIENSTMSQNSVTPILDTCVHWYKAPTLPPQDGRLDEAVFGYVFALVLSLGHHSAVWTEHLTRADRLVLYAAQVHLTCIQRDNSLGLAWLENPRVYFLEKSLCSACVKRFDSVWDASFGQLGRLDSPMPLEDVSKLVRLPKYRQTFANLVCCQTWELQCKKNQCGERMLHVLDTWIVLSFVSLTEEHKYFAT